MLDYAVSDTRHLHELADILIERLEAVGRRSWAEEESTLMEALRWNSTGEVDPVGGSGPVKVDIRLISATNRDLQAMIAEGRFREDLYYRIGVFPLALPPLRERREDLPGLARMFLARSTAAEGIAIDNFSTAAMEAISRGS
ncbi:MAG: sigma 54-interacting transcriptional regulator, partial [Gemmatimonadetes bacterium]|nr:sigma 54-interacting transcriptional regulator [Gemmatimonadota bacterium]